MTLVNRERLCTSVNKELLNNLKQLSEETRIPMSRLLDEAIEDLLNKHKNNE